MTPRERILGLAVGGLAVVTAISYGTNTFREAVDQRRERQRSLKSRSEQLFEQRLVGERAGATLGGLMTRSLPADIDAAESEYNRWLLDTATRAGWGNVVVNRPGKRRIMTSDNSRPLYTRLSFGVSASTDMESFLDFLHQFHSTGYLHRIATFSLTPKRQGSGFDVKMDIDTLSLADRPAELESDLDSIARVDKPLDQYRDDILNRNLFEPPNQAPRFAGKSKFETTVESDINEPLVFKDPENHPLKYELVDAPEDVEVDLSESTGTLKFAAEREGEYDIRVRVTDGGYPARTTEETLVVKIDPKPIVEPEKPKPKYDDAKQTFLTGLTGGGGEWEAWIRVRTRAQTLRLRSGDAFEIGTVVGKVVDVNDAGATLEVDGKRYAFQTKSSLKETVDGDPIPSDSNEADSDEADSNEADPDENEINPDESNSGEVNDAVAETESVD